MLRVRQEAFGSEVDRWNSRFVNDLFEERDSAIETSMDSVDLTSSNAIVGLGLLNAFYN